MEDVKFTVRMLGAYMKESIADLAKNSGIDPNHLLQVSCGRVKMTADDMLKLSKYTGIDVHKIQN